MRWDEILDPRLAAYRASAITGKAMRSATGFKTGGPVLTPPHLTEGWGEAFLAAPTVMAGEPDDIRIEWSREELMRPLLGPEAHRITKEAAYRMLGLEPPE